MKRRNQYISQLGVSIRIYGGNFVTGKKLYRMCQRYQYGFDYCDNEILLVVGNNVYR